MVNLRGVIVPIVDMRIRFGLSEVAYSGTTVTIVLNIGGLGTVTTNGGERMLILMDIEQLMTSPDMGSMDAVH